MKKVIGLTLLMASSVALAAQPQSKSAQLTAPPAASTSNQYQSITGKGAYVAALLGVGAGAGDSSSAGFGFGLQAGYRFTPALAAELGFSRYPMDGDASSLISGHSNVWSAAAVLSMPFQPKLTAFGKAGLALVQNSIKVIGVSGSNTSFAALLGGGLRYMFNQKVDFKVEADVTLGSDSSASTYGILGGVEYHFNS